MFLTAVFAAALTACGGSEEPQQGLPSAAAMSEVDALEEPIDAGQEVPGLSDPSKVAAAVTPARAAWRSCANEHGTCIVGTKDTKVWVRYGVSGRFKYRMVVNSVRCSNDVFGDPAVGQGKSCSWYGVVTPAPSGVPFVDVSKIPAASPGFSTVRIAGTSETTSQNEHTGQFRKTCGYSHMNFDDPIVFPGRPGASHLHVFFGNTGIHHASTQSSIETTGNSTCAGGIANRSGYWVPAVIDTRDGRPLAPTDILVYYKTDPLPGNRVKVPPAGLRMVAGNANSSGPVPHTDWGCLSDTSEQRGSAIPANCAVGHTVELTVVFPSCWDGVNLDAPDHKSHMAYPVGERTSPTGMGCPASHPVQLPEITEKIRYKVTEANSTARWRLSSDNYSTSLPGGYSAHADWFNGWDRTTLQTMVQSCLQANRDCHGYLLGNGTTLY